MSRVVRKLKHNIAKGVGDYACVNWEDACGDVHLGVVRPTLFFFDDQCCVEDDLIASIGAVFRERRNYDKYVRGQWPGVYYVFDQQEDTWILTK